MSNFVVPFPPPAMLPVAGKGLFPVRRVYCVGRNFADHAREMGGDPDRDPPFFFDKPADAVTHHASVPYPPQTERLEFEGELVIAVGHGGQDIPVERALEHVFGYTVGCDLTRRDLQAAAKSLGRPWDLAKGFDQSAVVGEIQPAKKIGHPQQGRLQLWVNGTLRQDGDLSQMIWSVPEIIASLSQSILLQPGDLIYTGTPAGVGALARGDEVVITIDAVGSHQFTVV